MNASFSTPPAGASPFSVEIALPDALADADPLVQALAFLDARVGRQRLQAAREHDFHPLVRRRGGLNRLGGDSGTADSGPPP